MKFELIKTLAGLEMYGDIPCLPVNFQAYQGERYIGEESDAWLLLEDFVRRIDSICPNDLDYGDVDFFDKDKCKLIKAWISGRNNEELTPRLKELYSVLEKYVDEAIRLETGIVIGL